MAFVGTTSAQIPGIPEEVRFRLELTPNADSVVVDSTLTSWGMRFEHTYGKYWTAWFDVWRAGAWADSLLKQRWTSVVVADVFNPIPVPDSLQPSMMLEEIGAPQGIQWGVTMVKAPQSWARGIDGSGIVVGVLDSGTDCGHQDLPNLRGGYNFGQLPAGVTDRASCAAFASMSICRHHGFHTAGTVAGQNGIGVAPGAQVYAMRVFDEINATCGAWTGTQLAALAMAADSGWDTNASIGGSGAGSYSIMTTRYAKERSTYMSASAGNDGGSRLLYPAGYNATVSVGALTSSGARASYSNRGSNLDVSAPGSSVVSLAPNNGYATKSGTSMAAPHVAGCMALIRQARELVMGRPRLSITETKMVLAITAVDLGTPGKDTYYGNGGIDCDAAVAFILSGAPIPAPYLNLPTGYTISRTANSGSPASTMTPYSAQVDTWEFDKADLPSGYEVNVNPWSTDATLRGYVNNTATPLRSYTLPIIWW